VLLSFRVEPARAFPWRVRNQTLVSALWIYGE
jgi:hypothetical protein